MKKVFFYILDSECCTRLRGEDNMKSLLANSRLQDIYTHLIWAWAHIYTNKPIYTLTGVTVKITLLWLRGQGLHQNYHLDPHKAKVHPSRLFSELISTAHPSMVSNNKQKEERPITCQKGSNMVYLSLAIKISPRFKIHEWFSDSIFCKFVIDRNPSQLVWVLNEVLSVKHWQKSAKFRILVLFY